MFMDDNALPHRAFVVNHFPEQECIMRMDRPVMSPDLNLMEHVWDTSFLHLLSSSFWGLAHLAIPDDFLMKMNYNGKRETTEGRVQQVPLSLNFLNCCFFWENTSLTMRIYDAFLSKM